VGLFRRGESGHGSRQQKLIPLKEMPGADKPVEFLGAKTYEQVKGFVFLLWGTRAGVLAAAYPTTGERAWSHAGWVSEFEPGIRCVIEVADQGFQAPDGPDVYDRCSETGGRHLWREYARVIGQPAPYWPWYLNHRELIEAWRPGNDVVTALPEMDPDMTPLLRLAALYEYGSPTHRVLMHYYFKGLWDSASGHRIVTEAFGEIGFRNLDNKLIQAARAVDVPEPPDMDDLNDSALRAVMSGILERHDTLAVEVIDRFSSWGAVSYLPFSRTARYRVGESTILAEWLQQLDEVPRYKPDPRFASLHEREPERTGRRYFDRATGAPVIERLDYHGQVEEYITLLPRRLPTTSPLAELIVEADGHPVWVRTDDGVLYPAPQGDYGVAWGYEGSGYAPLVERLLDDISAPALDRWITPRDNGLTRLTRAEVHQTQVFTRAELETAHRQPL
jgi:hypothetical protein